MLSPVLLLALLECFAAPPPGPWNFVVVLLDDVGWRDLGYAGNEFIETPHMDRLAAEGLVFANAYATHPFCSPTRQSLLSGQWPARTAWAQRSEVRRPNAPHGAPPFSPSGAHAWTGRRPEFVSIAEALKAAGYRTGHIGKWHFHSKAADVSPESEGFDVSFGGANMVGAVEDFFAPFAGLPGDVESVPGEYLTDRLTRETVDFIREHRDESFYVQLWHYAPHVPLMAPEPLVAKYRKKRLRLADESLNPTYAAMIDSVDRGIGRIVSELDRLELSERTLIFVTSDNGALAHFGSLPVTSVAPLRGEKGHLNEGGIRVPMFAYWPGQAPSVSVQNVSVMDIYPTILDVAGIAAPAGQPVDGRSLSPAFASGSAETLRGRALFWYSPVAGFQNGSPLIPAAAVLRGRWKLVRPFRMPARLYDVKNDPGETQDVAGTHPDRVARLGKRLNAWLRDTGIVKPTRNPAFDPAHVMSGQLEDEHSVDGAKVIRQWRMGVRLSPWREGRMIRTEKVNGALRMYAQGGYPQIFTSDVADSGPGVYAVKVELRVATPGRIRFDWTGTGLGGSIELYPKRNGEWHTLTALLNAQSKIKAIYLSAPTHLRASGHFDPRAHPSFIEVRTITLLSVEGIPAESERFVRAP